MNFLFNPEWEEVESKYGLVVGHVQSGKTANYTGLIGKAAYPGYDLIIVLAGLHNNPAAKHKSNWTGELTGKMIHPEGEHVSAPNGPEWTDLTNETDDFYDNIDPAILSSFDPLLLLSRKCSTPNQVEKLA